MSLWIGLLDQKGGVIPPDVVSRIPEASVIWRLKRADNKKLAFKNDNSLSFYFKKTPRSNPGYFSFFSDEFTEVVSICGAYEVVLDTGLWTIAEGDSVIFQPGRFAIMLELHLDTPPAVPWIGGGKPETKRLIHTMKNLWRRRS